MMINDVRNIVDFILNKESRGYITPLQFNTFAKQAQQEIVDDYFYDHNKSILGKNQRVTYKDSVSRTRESIDTFTVAPIDMVYATGFFNTPSNLSTTISLIYNGREVEEVPRDKLSYFLTNTVAGPSVFYPAYIKYENKYKVYPETIISGVKIVYFRNPKDPNWTYEMIGGNAIFNPSKQGFQDLEIGYDDKFKIISKILKYAGLNMREPDIVGAAIALENQESAK